MESFIGEVKIFAGNFPPLYWAFCDGQLLSINSYPALYSLVGTTYGGDGRTTFGLPDLRGRSPIHSGQGPGLSPCLLGKKVGAETQTLTSLNLPPHKHHIEVPIVGNAKINLGENAGFTSMAQDNYLGFHSGPDDTPYTSTPPVNKTMNINTIDTSELRAKGYSETIGAGEPFFIRSPALAMNYIICLNGIFPPRS